MIDDVAPLAAGFMEQLAGANAQGHRLPVRSRHGVVELTDMNDVVTADRASVAADFLQRWL